MVIWGFNEFDSVVQEPVSGEVATQLDMMRSLGINTVTFVLMTTDVPTAFAVPSSWFNPPKCYAYPSNGLLYPTPTKASLQNLSAFFDLAHAKGMKVILGVANTHMEEPRSRNALWLGPIVKAVKNKPALLMISLMGDVHVNTFSGKTTCGIPAEPALWLGADSTPGKYVAWAIGYAHSLGVPYRKVSAEAIVGANNTALKPLAVLKQIFDGLSVPTNERTYNLSWYEHPKCEYAQPPCRNASPSKWAAESMSFVRKTVGTGNGARIVASEFGDADEPVDPHWKTAAAFANLVTLWEKNGVDGGAFWIWAYGGDTSGYDTTLSVPVLLRGSKLQYSAMAPVIAQYYGRGPTPRPSPSPVPTRTPLGPCNFWPGGTGLLTDGDFVQESSTGTYAKGQSLAPEWIVTSGSVTLTNAGNMPYGVCAVNLDGSGSAGAIEHAAFATAPGTNYVVRFMLSGEPGVPRFKQLLVSAAGASKTFKWDVGDYNDINGFWGAQSWTFTAAAKSTTLTFQSLDTPESTANGPTIAGITVNSAP